MSQSSARLLLRQTLLAQYDDLARRLTPRLGSKDAAIEALQDVFLRLETGNEIASVANPRGYLIRMALNMAASRMKSERRRLSNIEIEAVLDIPDEEPDPEQHAASRQELEALRQVIRSLPARQRAIVQASWIEDTPHAVLAEQFGVSVRTIQLELKRSLEQCAKILRRNRSK